jgi:hypothetical protein
METIALSFESLRDQIEGGAASILERIVEPERNAALPVVVLRRGVTRVECAVASLVASDVLQVGELLNGCFRSLDGFRVGFGACAFQGDLLSAHDRRRAERKELGAGDLPAPIKIELRVGRDGRPGALSFEKSTPFVEEEVSAFLQTFAKLAARAGAGGGDPRAQIASLGAVLFDADPAFGEERIAGYAGTKRDVRESIVLPLLHPEVFQAVTGLARGGGGTSVPRAVLFEGPPGTGKTTMARVIGAQSGVPLVYVPVESIMSRFYGDSEKRLDALFDAASRLGRSIVFLDEIDSFAGSREQGLHEATRRVLSVLLRHLQGLVESRNVVVIGATNRKQDLDPALLSRFDRAIPFPLPDEAERAAIVGSYARHLGDGERAELAGLSVGRSGREIEDGCGVAERMWASELIAHGAPPSAPPLPRYTSAFHLKFGRPA